MTDLEPADGSTRASPTDFDAADPWAPPGPTLWPAASLEGVPAPEPVTHSGQRRGRGSLWAAFGLVVVLGGSALFGAGFLLGHQAARAPGTSVDRQQLFEPFWDAFDAIAGQYVGGVDQKKLVEGAIKGMFEAIGDPFSQYLTSEEYRNSISGISGQFEGIGAVMTTRDGQGVEGCETAGPDCHVVVLRTIRDSPAEKAGLRKDDEVVAVEGKPLAGLTLADTVGLVRGPRGTTVHLSLLRGGGGPLQLAIVRDIIETEAVSSEVIANGQVGYLRLDGFSSSAAADFHGQLKALVDQGLTRVVLDLRGDPGGFVDAAEKIASEFIAAGPVFWEEFADGSQQAHEAIAGGVATDPRIQVVVLIDHGSASASEIVAAALQDSGRARLVGATSYGKGTVQQWQTLTNDTGGFRLSVAKWLTPDKRWIHGIGLKPDVPVSAPADATSDLVLEKAVELLTGSTS